LAAVIEKEKKRKGEEQILLHFTDELRDYRSNFSGLEQWMVWAEEAVSGQFWLAQGKKGRRQDRRKKGKCL